MPACASVRAQYEVFTDFDDVHHIQQLATGGMTAALSRFVTAVIDFRAYRERQPRSVPDGQPGYDQWGAREDGLVGLTVSVLTTVPLDFHPNETEKPGMNSTSSWTCSAHTSCSGGICRI